MTGQVHPGALVRAWRERALLTQEQLAERAGLSARTIGRLESGYTGRLRTSSLELLATALDLDDAERSSLVAMARTSADPEFQLPPDDVPRQLPAPSPAFTGRSAELAAVDRVMDASAVVVASIDGMAGIGKTALAVHAAHRLAGHYPDGQLFLDLHGYTDGVAPVEPGDALARMLRALGLPDERIPQGLDDRAALYRSKLAGRKVLILLDDAADEGQVAPLVPGTPGCLVLVTSRQRLPGLDSTHAFSLDVLPLRDAAELFTRVTGDDRVAPALLAEVVELCDRLPLAIRIAAARLRARPAWTVAHLIERLRDHRQRLGELEAGLRSVTAALDLSYRQLGHGERRAFRLLGLHPGADFDLYAAAALIGSTPVAAGGLIGGLLDTHLVQEPTRGRYRFHDLVRAYATAQGTEPDRAEALTRLLDHYCHTASTAMDLTHPYERERRLPARPAGTPSPPLDDETAAETWLDAELGNLLAAAQLAADHGWPDHLRHLSAAMHRHLRTLRRYADAEDLHERALTAARARADRRGEAEALIGVGHMDRLQGRSERATERYQLALALARSCGHRPIELDALIYLGHMDRYRCRYGPARARFEEALEIAPITGDRAAEMEALIGLGWVRLESEHDVGDEFERGLDLARALGHRIGEGTALQAVGYAHRLHGRHDRAVGAFEQALELSRAIRSPWTELSALVDLARLHRLMGHAEEAAACCRAVLDLTWETSSPVHEAHAWYGLGRLHLAAGRMDEALVHHEQALELAIELGLPVVRAQARDGLAHVHIALGRHDLAREQWEDALGCLAGIAVGHTQDDDVTAESVRGRLERLAGTGPPARSETGRPSEPVPPVAQASSGVERPQSRGRPHE